MLGIERNIHSLTFFNVVAVQFSDLGGDFHLVGIHYLANIGAGIHLIAGGRGKQQDFTPLAPLVAERCRAVYLIGEAAGELAAALAPAGVPLHQAGDLQHAMALAREAAQELLRARQGRRTGGAHRVAVQAERGILAGRLQDPRRRYAVEHLRAAEVAAIAAIAGRPAEVVQPAAGGDRHALGGE